MKNSMSTILPSFGIWSKLERWKSSISRCLMSWPQIKKIVLLKCCLCLFYTTTTNHFLIKLRCAMKIGFYMTTGDDQLNGWTEKKLQSTTQSQTSTKNRSWSWWSAAYLIHYSFLNPSKIITCEKYMFSLSMRCTKNYNTCSWHWLTARAQFFSMTTNASEVEWSVRNIHLTSCQLTTTPSSI